MTDINVDLDKIIDENKFLAFRGFVSAENVKSCMTAAIRADREGRNKELRDLLEKCHAYLSLDQQGWYKQEVEQIQTLLDEMEGSNAD